MLRTLNIALIALMLGGAGVVYHLKYEAEKASNRVAKIERKIGQERDAIATLKAEWSLLNQPKRLQELVEKYHSYVELDPLDPMQIGSIDEIPFRPVATSGTPAPSGPVPTGTKTAQGSVKLATPKAAEHTGSVPKPAAKATERAPSSKTSDPATAKGIDPRPNDPLLKIIH